MSMVDTLRNGLKFLLMSMGISSPAKKTPAAKAPAKPSHEN
jgi:hypothetical protein